MKDVEISDQYNYNDYKGCKDCKGCKDRKSDVTDH